MCSIRMSVAACLLAFAGAAQASGSLVGTMLEAQYQDGEPNAYALGFTYGVWLGLEAAWKPEESLICAPEKATASQAAAIVGKYLRDHPEKWHESAEFLVGSALIAAWPCNSQAAE